MDQCPVCGKILDDTFCTDCAAAWRRDLDAGRYPKGGNVASIASSTGFGTA